MSPTARCGGILADQNRKTENQPGYQASDGCRVCTNEAIFLTNHCQKSFSRKRYGMDNFILPGNHNILYILYMYNILHVYGIYNYMYIVYTWKTV